MPTHNYTPHQALEALMRRLSERDPALAEEIRFAINAGRDIQELEPLRGRRKKARVYRKTVRFTDEEALEVAIDALRAHFVEQPLFANSASADFKAAALGTVRRPGPPWRAEKEPPSAPQEGKGQQKVIEIELETATQISGAGPPTLRLDPVPEDQLEQQKINLERLADLLAFRGN